MALTARAEAMPSLARQTGQPCTACHVGGFGPQLNSYGRDFKLRGYTDARELDQGEAWVPPVSAMALVSFTHTKASQSGGAAKYFDNNNNFALDQASLFWAGKVFGPVGAFIQYTYDGVGRHAGWDNADIRIAHVFALGGTDILLGATLNNNPTVQDAWNTTPAWGFPYVGSALAPTPTAALLIDGGLAQTVLGATVYTLIDGHYYFEFGAYRGINPQTLEFLGTEPQGLNKVHGMAPYGRVVYQNAFGVQDLAFGAVGLHAELYPGGDRTFGTDKYTDLGVDASYQYPIDDMNMLSFNASLMQEWQRLDATYASGGSANRNDRLTSFKANASYYYNQSIGLTVGYFGIWGTRDGGLYASDPIGGSRTSSPRSSGVVAQVDWTPFGKADSFASPFVNLRLGLQYTAYLQFNGASHNYDGFGRNASDNNTVFAFAWLAF
ncbi:MAG: hypothetical protein ABI439_12435 [Rhodospirillales bacterium]